MIQSFLLVAAGGALGSMLRFAMGNLVSFPFGTMAVNILGAFFAGAVFAFFINKVDAKLYFLLMPGFLGGFTTFSAFSVDVLKLWNQQNLNVLSFIVQNQWVLVVAVFSVGSHFWAPEGGIKFRYDK